MKITKRFNHRYGSDISMDFIDDLDISTSSSKHLNCLNIPISFLIACNCIGTANENLYIFTFTLQDFISSIRALNDHNIVFRKGCKTGKYISTLIKEFAEWNKDDYLLFPICGCCYSTIRIMSNDIVFSNIQMIIIS